jgi:hypothetical protein
LPLLLLLPLHVCCVLLSTGFVAEYSAQPFNRDGWGGLPLDVTASVEKDKTNTCLQVSQPRISLLSNLIQCWMC